MCHEGINCKDEHAGEFNEEEHLKVFLTFEYYHSLGTYEFHMNSDQ